MHLSSLLWTVLLVTSVFFAGASLFLFLGWLKGRKELRKLKDEIHRMNVKRTDFVANVSHELKTPLTSIRGYTETLRNGALSDPTKADAFLKRIEENAERLDSLIHDILDLSKLEVTDSHLELGDVNLTELFSNLKEQFNWKLEEKKQKLEIESEVDQIRADQQLLEQVFSNLIANAIRYCPEGAMIQLRAKPVQSGGRPSALFEIIDNGPGIPEKDLPRIFERFYRADKSRNRAFGGTGLGLAIVKHIVLSHQGKLKAENVSSGGMKFSLWFPLETEKRSRKLS